MNISIEDTIAAIATPAGEGGIGIIRISGPEAKCILGRIFSRHLDVLCGDGPDSLCGLYNEGPNKGIRPRELTYGFVVDPLTGEAIDEVLAVYMPSPNTYTKEDVVEINCHGGSIPLSRTMGLVLREGARVAEPGEFTKRAFLNGRIDLSQAEAVLDVINAKTEDSLSVAITQLQGKFSEEIAELRKMLTDILVNIDVNIDYPDEDIEEVTYEKLEADLGVLKDRIEKLVQSARSGKILRDGLSIAIVGKPNVGKSSLLNVLLRESRAIVTEIPGTTRDTIEEFANIRGIPVCLTDTAGIRDTDDIIESIGIERSRKSLEEADLAILMIDVSEEIGESIRELLDAVTPEKTILLFNKGDKERLVTDEEIAEISRGFAASLVTTLVEGQDSKESLRAIEDAIFDASGYAAVPRAGVEVGSRSGNARGTRSGNVVTNVRHRAILESAEKSVSDAIDAVRRGEPLELIEIDVASAYENLGFITGESVQDDIIDQVFSRFCLGK